jgi:signal peptidase II
MRVTKTFLPLILLLMTVGCDRFTKHLATTHLADKPALSYLGDTLRLEYAENPGAFLSLGSRLPEPVRFVLFRVGVAAALFAILAVALLRRWRGYALAGVMLLFGGGISNLIDRIIQGNVVDFASVGIGSLRTGIFNIADVAIMLGGAFIVIGSGVKTAKGDA